MSPVQGGRQHLSRKGMLLLSGSQKNQQSKIPCILLRSYLIIHDQSSLDRAKRVPNLLSPKQTRDRLTKASDLVALFRGSDLKCLATGDATWFYFHEPENKENNRVWFGENEARTYITCRSRTVWCIMYALFQTMMDQQHVSLYLGIHRYQNLLKVLALFTQHCAIKRSRTGVRVERRHLFHDNAPVHRLTMVNDHLEQEHLKLFHTLPVAMIFHLVGFGEITIPTNICIHAWS